MPCTPSSALCAVVFICFHPMAAQGRSLEWIYRWQGQMGLSSPSALWGSSQLLFALIQLLAVIRYRSLIPFMWLMLALEVLLRELVGAMKPITFAHTPPGAIGNQIILPLAVVMVVWSLWSGSKNIEESK
ncbi:MAG: hypothetical protein IPG80_00870 [Anaerolineales bacterium]|uniref:hypothetical protein n=1 Tax=Candidatus Villigracilis vicinus TaxID=3140679 RepID=UPI003136C97F|nr:hypothetical protein [Anaerolineales bacterium]